ncbi:glycosyltransferase family 4 protein [Myxacorys almedinensis]|uniref:Glycosyltransferase n=1 Tax=Myxacorys almedinensis A TaxID=2690445 RepID=A0A8J7Z5M3_9CYAN|nr:glycosyltransferase family 4 protein [Myxacorys almedinensis]NDJ18311.1 glycosyltransferase [Myxacorys almedinensis A]
MNILMVSATFPYPPTKGGTQVRTFHLLNYLQQFHPVTVLTQRTDDVTDAEVATLRDRVTELVVFPRPHTGSSSGLAGKVTRFASFLQQGTPPSVLAQHSAEMQAWIDRAVQKQRFEVITCEHSVNERYVRPEFRQQLRTVVNVHSSVYGSCRNQLQTGTSEQVWRDRLNLPLLKRYEQRYCKKFCHLVVTTDDDRNQLYAFDPTASIEVIPNGVDFSAFPYRAADPGGHHLVFIGAMDNLANIDAAKFLSLNILPALREHYPDTTLALVGSRPTADIQNLGEQPGIVVTGQVPSMAEYLHQATVCVIPMRTGYGIKNKTLEAMAAGAPVVASDRGLEGLVVDGANTPLRALRANSMPEYVQAISRLFEDPTLRSQLSHTARSLVESDYTWERAGQRYLKVLEGKMF